MGYGFCLSLVSKRFRDCCWVLKLTVDLVRIAYASLHILSSLVVPSTSLVVAFEILDLLGVLIVWSAISRTWRFQTESEKERAGQETWERALRFFVFEILPATLIIAGGVLRGSVRTYTIGTVLYKIGTFIFLLWAIMFFIIALGYCNVQNGKGSSNIYWWMSILLLMRLAWAIACVFKNQIYVPDLQGKAIVWYIFLAISPELLILVIFYFNMPKTRLDRSCPDTTIDVSKFFFVDSDGRRELNISSGELAELELRAQLFEEETFRLYGATPLYVANDTVSPVRHFAAVVNPIGMGTWLICLRGGGWTKATMERRAGGVMAYIHTSIAGKKTVEEAFVEGRGSKLGFFRLGDPIKEPT